MKKSTDEMTDPTNCYNDLVTRLGCAACLYRDRSLCKHPNLRDHYQLRGNIFYYVENSCASPVREIRPVWCPALSQKLMLPSEADIPPKPVEDGVDDYIIPQPPPGIIGEDESRATPEYAYLDGKKIKRK